MVAKSSNLDFYIGGIVQEDVEFTTTNVAVTIDGINLYNQDFPKDVKVAAGGNFQTTFEWYVPGFAPKGHYHTQVSILGKVGGSKDSVKVGCITAEFDFS